MDRYIGVHAHVSSCAFGLVSGWLFEVLSPRVEELVRTVARFRVPLPLPHLDT
jgi:hypothetical protein